MLAEIRLACLERGAQPPESAAEYAKVVFDSLARSYRDAAALLSDTTGRPVTRVHIVSGGSRNGYLCRRTAAEIGVPVVAGPAEASAIGNLLLQAQALGLLAGDSTTDVLARSFRRTRYGGPGDE